MHVLSTTQTAVPVNAGGTPASAGVLYNERSIGPPSTEVMPNVQGEVSCLLQEIRIGVPDAEGRLLDIVYSELRKLAAFHLRRDRSGHTLQPTALVNEAYLRLMDGQFPNLNDRNHFFAVASRVMRRILVDYARSRQAQKRGAAPLREDFKDVVLPTLQRAEDFLALDQALSRLAAWDERQERIVELRFFGGLTEEEIAEVLGISVRTVKREWAMARAWLHSQLES